MAEHTLGVPAESTAGQAQRGSRRDKQQNEEACARGPALVIRGGRLLTEPALVRRVAES